VAGKRSSPSPAPSGSEWHVDEPSLPRWPSTRDEPPYTKRVVMLESALQEQLALEELLMLERESLEQDDG
jgi:hypothetical protein